MSAEIDPRDHGLLVPVERLFHHLKPEVALA
jgi:hypothetical protein